MICSGHKGSSGLIFNIQRFSLHDGPGIRDLIFLKGCASRCKWCSNPESQNAFPEIAYNHQRCIGIIECGLCGEVCPVDAIKKSPGGKIKIDRRLCTNCGRCAEACAASALKLFGAFMSVDEVLSVIEEDSAFYWRSGGGITISGGDPLSQPEFVQELLRDGRARGLDTAIETSGYGYWEDVSRICKYANLVFYDIKCLDPKRHKAFTGISNELILENISKLSLQFPQTPIVVRTPVIPGFNDSAQISQGFLKSATIPVIASDSEAIF